MPCKKILTGFLFLFSFFTVQAQKGVSVFTVDSLSLSINSSLPFNSPVTLLIPLVSKDVTEVYLIEKHKYHDLASTMDHYIKAHPNGFFPNKIDEKFYNVRERNSKDTLVLNFKDELLLKPSTSYFLIIVQKNLSSSVWSFFENYYKYKQSGKSADLTEAKIALTEFDKSMQAIFGSKQFNFGWYSPRDFAGDTLHLFDTFFESSIKSGFIKLSEAENHLNTFVVTESGRMVSSLPKTDSLLQLLTIRDTTFNKEALLYLTKQDFVLNDALTDIYLSNKQRNIEAINSGQHKLGCISCDPTDAKNYNVRIGNIDQSLGQLNQLLKSLNLIRPRYQSGHDIENAMRRIDQWIGILQSSKDSLKKIVKIKTAIESKILDEKVPYQLRPDTVYKDFLYSSVVSGNSLLNFDTRNKVLLTPDFGIVSSAWNKKGRSLDYGIVPYFGFHINFMAVDKDIAFDSYKKHWRQYWSLMVGWSLVNLQKDSTYSNFFEKSSLLTGVGFRLSNAFRLTAGAQWLFKDDPEKQGNNRSLYAIPFAGVSLDLNIKQYIGDFVSLLSGVGKTTNTTKIKTETQTSN